MNIKVLSMVVVCTALFSSFIIPTEAVFEDAILEALEQVRIRMCHPIPQLGLPMLDPLQIKQAKLSLNNKYLIDFKGSINNFNLTGLSDFIVNDLKITTIPLRRSSFDITLPLTGFKTLYTAKGSLAYILNLAGDGLAEARIDTIRLSASWIFKTDIYLGIRSLKLKLQINDIYVKFEKLFEEERISNFMFALVNELGLELLNDIWQVENEFVERLLEKIINNLIGDYTIADIIKILGSGEGDPIFAEGPPGDCKDENDIGNSLIKTNITYNLKNIIRNSPLNNNVL